MKPRIKRGFDGVWLGTWIYFDGWDCVGDGRKGFGVTPETAYQEWAKVKWPPGAVVEQHTHPLKPTLWQRFVRWCDSSLWDPSERIG